MYVAGGEDRRTRSNLTLKMTRRALAVASSFFSPIFFDELTLYFLLFRNLMISFLALSL